MLRRFHTLKVFLFHKQCRPRHLVTFTIVVCTENDLLASVYKGEEKKKSCSVFSPLRLRSFRAKLRCLRLACRSYEQPNRASGHMVVMPLLESVCAATERPWYALCADPISGLGSENSKSVGGSKSRVRSVRIYVSAREATCHFRCANQQYPCFAPQHPYVYLCYYVLMDT